MAHAGWFCADSVSARELGLRRGRSTARQRGDDEPGEDAAAPTSCSAEGYSPRISAANTTEQTGWSVSETEVTTAGSRGREIAISSQPSTCELSASSISHPCADQLGVQSRSPYARPISAHPIAEANVASSNGPAGPTTPRPPWRSVSRNPEYISAVRIP